MGYTAVLILITALVLHQVVVVLTLTRIGQAPVTLELGNTPGTRYKVPDICAAIVIIGQAA